jgi:hypothetical protein
VILSAGALVGLPPGVPSVVYDIAWWRDLLLLVALASAAGEARARRRAALALAIVVAVLSIGFWVAAFARPYGVLTDPATTRWAADVAVAGASGADERFLVGEAGASRFWTGLARHVRPDLVLLIPTVLPLFVVPAGALVIALLWANRESTLAAILWLGGATSSLDVLRGTGFLTGLWSRPRTSLLWVATVAAVLLVGRLRLPWRARVVAGALLIGAWTLLGRRGPEIGLAEALLALTFDHRLWLVLGVVGLMRSRDASACALVLGGSLLALVRSLGGPGDAWAGTTLSRLGLVLATTEWLVAMAPMLAPRRVHERTAAVLRRLGIAAERVPSAGAVALTLAGGLLAWWDPPRTDLVAKESLVPFPRGLTEAMDWVRGNTARDAAVLAGEDYVAAVPVLGGRRVLRAPGLLTAVDDERRRRLQRAVLAGDPPPALLRRYGLRYILTAPGQFREEGTSEPEDLEGRGPFRLLYASASGIRVYEILAVADARRDAAADGPDGTIK